jgi:hypothetical protein
MEVRILDEILATDSRIRYAGILDEDLKTVSSKAREPSKDRSKPSRMH